MAVSEWCELKTGWVMKGLVLSSPSDKPSFPSWSSSLSKSLEARGGWQPTASVSTCRGVKMHIYADICTEV